MKALRLLSGAATLCVGLLAAATASSAVISFDQGTGNGQQGKFGFWEESGFRFEPAQRVQSSQCFDGRCLQEITQTQLTTMTKIGGGNFDLSFFYGLLTGKTTGADNSFTVWGNKGMVGEISATFQLGDAMGKVVNGVKISKAFASSGDPMAFNDGYWFDVVSGWTNLTKVSWIANPIGSNQDGQMRLDCVGANESVTGAVSQCIPTTTPIPLPAAAWMLLAGVGGLAAMRRRKQAA